MTRRARGDGGQSWDDNDSIDCRCDRFVDLGISLEVPS